MSVRRVPAVLLILAALSAGAVFADKPFELWPSANGQPPTLYVKQAPAFNGAWIPWKFPRGVPVTVKVDATRVLRRVNPYMTGMNSMVWCGKDWFLNPDRLEKARQAGLRFWRFPGGSYSNTYHWDGDYKGRTTNNENRDPSVGSQPNFIQTDDFIEFCRQVGAEAIVTVNYGCARYESPEEAADLAARWVKYFNVKKRFKVRYWEIGNENYGPWEDGYKVEGQPPMSGSIYGKDFAVIADAMKKVDPDIFVGAPCVRFDGGGQWDGYLFWMRDMLPLVAGQADFLVQHNYFGKWPYNGSTYVPNDDETILRELSAVQDIKTQNDAMVAKYTKLTEPLPVAFTEFNLLESPTQTLQLFNGLYEAAVLGEQMKAGFAASNIWDWQNTYEAKTGGDNGLLARGDPDVADNTPRPTYYTYAIYDRAFGDQMVESSSSNDQVRVYASTFAGGEVGLILVNQGKEALSLSFDFTGFNPKGKAMGWILTGKDIHDKRVSFNGVWGPEGGGGPFPIKTLPPYRGKFNPGKPWFLPLPPQSLTGVVFY